MARVVLHLPMVGEFGPGEDGVVSVFADSITYVEAGAAQEGGCHVHTFGNVKHVNLSRQQVLDMIAGAEGVVYVNYPS